MKNSTLFLTLLICFLSTVVSGQTDQAHDVAYPPHDGFINDFEHILTESQEKTLDSFVTDFEERTGIEIAIVTIDSTMTSKESFDSFTLGLANYWGVGKKELDNGILIGVSLQLRTVRIQNGHGIEEILSDEETAEIVNEFMIPNFKNGDYFNGIKTGTLELMKELR